MTTQKPKHYQLFRKNLENPIVAYELLQAHLPQEVLAIIDTSTLKLEKESFVEPDLSTSIADVLFSVKFNDTDGYIYLLLEHQSTPEHFMAFRLFKYMVNILYTAARLISISLAHSYLPTLFSDRQR